MRTYKEFAEANGGDLNPYASGDGSISFTWSRYRTSLGIPVTPTHISLWRDFSNRFPKLEILNKKSGAVLFAPVTRIDENTLTLEGEIYTYEKDVEFTAEARHIITLRGEDNPYNHGSCEALAINFYLRNEKEILRQQKEGLY